jgi:hydrogenase-4 component B
MILDWLTALLWPGALFGQLSPMESIWLGFSAWLWAMATVYAGSTMADHGRLKQFWLFWALAFVGNMLLIIAQDALSFYIGFSIMSLSAYVLVIYDGTPAARRAGRLYLQLAIVSELALLAALLLIAHENGGTTAFADWQSANITPPAAILLITGLGLKAGFWPLHVWLPLAHPAAPAAASAVLSGAMIKAGALGLWKMMPAGALAAQWAEILMMVGMVSALFGVLMGLTRTDVKQVLAYSSVSQSGYLLILVALTWLLPEQRAALGIMLAIYAAHHGLTKGSLFIAADLSKRRQSTGQRVLISLLLGISALSIAGLPLSSGAAAKTGLKAALETGNLTLLLGLLSIGAVASALLVIRALILMRAAQRQAKYPPQKMLATLSWLILAATPLFLAWFWAPMQVLSIATLAGDKLWSLAWPILAGLALTAIAWRFDWSSVYRLSRRPGGAVLISLWIKHQCGRFAHQRWRWSTDLTVLRRAERRWNRTFTRATVNLSAALLVVVMLLTGILMNL